MMKIYQLFLLVCFLALTSIEVNAQNISGAASPFFNVRSYGAKGDGKKLDQIAINNAITACFRKGGGTVYVPAGKYLCGSIRMKSNINLHLAAGATIVGAPAEMHAYDAPEPFPDTAYQDGGHTYFHNSLIWGENLSNVSITGNGMIDGAGLTRKDKEIEGRVLGGSIGTGDKAIAFKLCKNVLIRDITIFHGGHFAILITGCDRTTLDNLNIDTNRDGIDIDCCVNTVVSNCRVNSPGDDAICPKSSYALNRAVLTENLIINNCQVSAFEEGTLLDGRRIPHPVGWSGGRIKFGTESNGGFRNCVVSNCTFWHCNGIALEEVDGGIIDNIMIANITMVNVNHYPIYVTLGQRNRGPKSTMKMGIVRNVFINNISVTGADSLSGIQLTGIPGGALENIVLENIHITYKGGGTQAQAQRAFPELNKGYPEPFLLGPTPSYGVYARHIKGLELSNLSFTTEKNDDRPVIVAEDIDGLSIDRFKFPERKGIKAYRFTNVNGLSVERAPLIKTDKMN